MTVGPETQAMQMSWRSEMILAELPLGSTGCPSRIGRKPHIRAGNRFLISTIVSDFELYPGARMGILHRKDAVGLQICALEDRLLNSLIQFLVTGGLNPRNWGIE